MNNPRVAVLGTTGMLGSMVFDYLLQQNMNVTPINRMQLDAATCQLSEVQEILGEYDYVINCMGIVRQIINSNSPEDCLLASRVNGELPFYLSTLNATVIQPATDCVFDGKTGSYTESSPRSPTDIYGLTKSGGETEDIYHLRCSIIGPELKSHHSLLDKLILCQPRNATIQGHTNHFWNGVTTLHWARICAAIIQHCISLRHIQHIVPANSISKYNLLCLAARSFHREDITIQPFATPESVNLTLSTIYPIQNLYLWKAAGYQRPPTIETMLDELAAYVRKETAPCES